MRWLWIVFALVAVAAPPLAARSEPERPAADDTERNALDRAGETLTPMDQGESEGDLRITQQIRRRLMGAEGLSTNARNAKVITRDGEVTLRGPVETPDEKQFVGSLAQSTEGVARVRNDLEVTGNR